MSKPAIGAGMATRLGDGDGSAPCWTGCCITPKRSSWTQKLQDESSDRSPVNSPVFLAGDRLKLVVTFVSAGQNPPTFSNRRGSNMSAPPPSSTTSCSPAVATISHPTDAPPCASMFPPVTCAAASAPLTRPCPRRSKARDRTPRSPPESIQPRGSRGFASQQP